MAEQMVRLSCPRANGTPTAPPEVDDLFPSTGTQAQKLWGGRFTTGTDPL